MDSKFTWETKELQVAKESVEKLVKSFFHAEQIRWTESGSPLERDVQTATCSCSKHGSLSQDSKHCVKLDPGFRILRHGKNIRHIHAYFQTLEPHRYRPKLTAGNVVVDRPDSSVRVVKRGDSRIDQNPQSAGGASSIPNDQIVLKEEDWKLYEMVVMCCQAPYLSAPPVPSPYSPSSSPSSPTSLHAFEFSYSPPPRAQINSPFRSRAFSFGSIISPEPTPPANPTSMRELVRKTYGLTKHMHSSREKQIKEKMHPKNSERVLVEDLLTQLYLLNNNCHPYYRIQSFLDKNGYDEWVTAEKENINRLIKVFWLFPLPPCPSAYPLNQFDAHHGYETLLKRFIRYESANETIHSIYGDVTPSAPLSAAACRILKEFGLRYGVGALYRKLVYLRYLVDHFECELWIIQHVAVLVEEVMQLVTLTPEIYVKEEFAMILYILTLLLRLSKYYLTRVTRLFPKNSPPGGVTALVTMAQLVQDAALYMNAKFPSVFTVLILRDAVHEFKSNLVDEPFEALLAGFLTEEVEGRYERFKVIAAYKLEVDSYAPPLTPNLLNILIYDIQEEITIYKTYYQAEFEKYVDFVQLSAVTFYKLLMLDVQEMCAHIPCRQDKVDLRMLALAYRLSILDRDMSKYLPTELQTWREPLLQLSFTWLDIVGQHLKRLVPALLEKETWRPVEVTQDDVKTTRSSLTSKVMKISKQQLFTQSCNSAFRRVQHDMQPLVQPSNVMSVSNPLLNHSEYPMNPEDHHTLSTTTVDTSQQPQSSTVGSFKGNAMVIKATVHVPRTTDEKTSKMDGGLSRSVPIEELFFQTSSDSGQHIRTIDISDEHKEQDGNKDQPGKTSQTGQTSQTGISQTGISTDSDSGQDIRTIDISDEHKEQDGNKDQSGKTSPTGQTSQTGISSQTGINVQNGISGLTEPTSQTGISNQNEQATESGRTDANDVESGQTGLTGQKAFCKTIVTVSNLTGYSTNQPEQRDSTPYENVDEVSSGTSSDYKTAESSPSIEGGINVEQNHTRLDVANNIPNKNALLDSADGKSDGILSDVECRTPTKIESTDYEVESAIIDSKVPISKTQLGDPFEECDNCPLKVVDVIPDIEDASSDVQNTPILNSSRTAVDDHGDEDWNRPGPSGLQPSNMANKHLIRALESDVTSVRSEYGSAPSRVTITSYDSAPYGSDQTRKSSNQCSIDISGSESRSDQESGESVDNSLGRTPSLDKPEPVTELLPLSSSIVDLLCCMNRLTAFTCHLCTILCPNEVTEGSADAELVRRETLRMKTALCGKLIQISKDMVFLYTDTLMAVETCGLTDRELMSILGAQPARELIDRCTQDEITGCRLNPGSHIRCNTTNSRGKKVDQCEAMNKIKCSFSGCESASSKMGIRNSNVTVISSLLSWLHDRMTLTISCNKTTGMNLHGNGCRQRSESYCHNGPSVDSNSQDSQAECQQQHGSESRYLSQSVDESLDECCVRLDDASDMQCKLVAHRLNDLFVKILHQLLNLSLPTFDVKKRLQPIIDFLHKRLTSLRRVMFPDAFLATIKYLWRHVVQDFTEEVELLKERRSDATEQSVLLLNSMAYLMQFFHGCGRGISYDELISTTQVVTKHIELYTAPSDRLIRLYRWLYDQMLTVRSSQLRNVDEFASSISGSSHQSRAHAPADHLIQSMRLQLHATSKCFSGADLIEWVQDYVRENGYDSLGVCIGISDIETGVELGQYLLERNFLACVTFPSHADIDADSNEQTYSKTRISKGTVFMKNSNALSSQMRFNDISITKKSGNVSHPDSSRSSSRPATDTSELMNSNYSSSSIESEDMDTRDLLDSVDIILRQADSNQSMIEFQNSSDVFYSFLNDEDGSGGQFKYKLDFTDRFSIRIKLEQIICVLYTRKRKDVEAKLFLKRLPKDFIAQAIGYKETPWCFHI